MTIRYPLHSPVHRGSVSESALPRVVRTLARIFGAFVAVACVLPPVSPVHASANIVTSTKPISDAQGRKQVIVDFTAEARLSYPEVVMPMPLGGVTGFRAPMSEADAIAAKAIDFFHHPTTEALVRDIERQYGFSRLGMTSWVGDSVTAMLSREQIAALLKDPRVKQISEDEWSTFSWADTSNGGETISWGHQAVSGKVRTATNNRKVYVVDTGVAYHGDLGSVIQRINVACGASDCNASNPIQYPVVGCYPHGTHVAGIIGATYNNNTGTAGVYAGARIVSVAISAKDPTANCAINEAPSSSAIGYALDYIYWDTLYNNATQLVNIVNISINPAGLAFDPNYRTPLPNHPKLQTAVTPAFVFVGCPVQCLDENDGYRYYPGVFAAQSAGNNNRDYTCYTGLDKDHYTPSYASDADPEDGIMVVGAINSAGLRPNMFFSPTVPANQTLTEPSSNYGPCVDIVAPGDAIYSTWGEWQPSKTLANVTYHNIASISGTSMAAPHVAAAAAYYADTYGLWTPGAIEQKIRQRNPAGLLQLN